VLLNQHPAKKQNKEMMKQRSIKRIAHVPPTAQERQFDSVGGNVSEVEEKDKSLFGNQLT
jgi:hypothetical protein